MDDNSIIVQKRSQNAQPQNQILCSSGAWGIPQQAKTGGTSGNGSTPLSGLCCINTSIACVFLLSFSSYPLFLTNFFNHCSPDFPNKESMIYLG